MARWSPIERTLRAQYGPLLVGVDEVGRGPLAGPVVACAVVMPPDQRAIAGVNDSKQLDAATRVALDARIREQALVVSLGAASAREIDRINIYHATILAMRRALARVPARLGHEPHHVLVDGKHAFALDVTAGFNRKLFEHLDNHLISEAVEIIDHTENFAQFHLAGPKAAATLSRALGQEIPDLTELLHMERTFPNGVTAHVRRHDPLGLPGFDIVVPVAKAEEVKALLLHSGASEGSPETFETLRVEAGTPVYGIDIGEDRFVMETPRPLRAVSYDKGCYLGQEPIVMARDRAGFVNRSFFGVKVDGIHPLPAGTKLFRDTQEVGLVTSSVMSPRLKAPVAIGYLRRGHQDPGLKLTATVGDESLPVEVLGYPPV